MITVEQTAEGTWLATCPHCGWQFTQAIHTKTRHNCPLTQERYTYVPADWETRSREEKNPYLLHRVGGSVIIAEDDPRRELKEPGLLVKANNYRKARAEHKRAGKPEATDEQVAERFAICQACPLFKPKGDGQGVCTHPSCGCSLKTVGLTGRNKLRWAEQQCPLPAPRWKALPPAPGGE